MNATQNGGSGRLIFGSILVVLGVLLLLVQVLDVDIFVWTWPFFVIVPGLVMLSIAVSRTSAHPLAIPGSIVTSTGLLLFFQQASDLFATWSYAWALIAPTSVGLGIWLMGRLDDDSARQRDGIHLMEIGLALFAAGFVFFEMVLNLSGLLDRTATAALGGVLLIAGGALLILWSVNRNRGGTGSRV